MARDLMSGEEALSLLVALGVEEVHFSLSGGGDDGTIELEGLSWKDRHPDGSPVVPVDLEKIPYFQGNLMDALSDGAAEWPDGDWCNNEGGRGSIIIRPFAEDEEERLMIDMTYGDEEADDDEFGEDLEVDGEDDEEADDADVPGDRGPAPAGDDSVVTISFDEEEDESPAPGGPAR